jgi:hypothetical protein
VRSSQLLARVTEAALVAQPLAEEQTRAGELWAQLRTAEPIDRFAVELSSSKLTTTTFSGLNPSSPMARPPSNRLTAAT